MTAKSRDGMAEFDVALVADMCVDLLLRGNVRPAFRQVEQLIDGYELEIGGSANVFACQAAKLGLNTAVLGAVGADAFGEHLLARLAVEGVDTSLVRTDAALVTGLGVTLTEPDDRAILTYLGTIDALGPDDLPADPGRLCRHWHVASFFLLRRLRAAWPAFFRHARDAGVTTSLDTNWDPEESWDGVDALLRDVDLFFPNEAEALAISGEHDVLRAARRLATMGPITVVKLGAKGAIAAQGKELAIFRPHEAVDGIIDTVGAGDNFAAGFLRLWMEGGDLDSCLAFGHRCAASSLTGIGGIAGQWRGAVPDPNEMEPA